MAITARTLASKLSLGLQSRVFSIPWVKTNKSMLCMKGRECSSSVPVRYIPNKVARMKEPKNSQSLKGFQENDEIDESWNGVERRSIILSEEKSGSRKPMTEKNFMFDDAKKDGSAWLGKEIYQNFVTVDLELIDELEEVDEEIESYQGKAKQKILLQCKTMKDAEKLAVGLLATRAFTAFELRKKLLGKKFPPVTVEAVINDFQSRGLLNDSLYAETFAQSRFSSSSWGPRRIKQALFKKGVGEVDSERALKFVFKDGESNEDHESNLGLSKQSMDHLFVQASNQWLRGQDVPNEKRKSRIIRWLQYRGFSWGVIGSILKKLESQYEVDSERAGKFVFKDGKSNEAQESNLGLSKQSMDDLFVQASKQWLRGQDVPKEKRKSRIIRWLQYRGFSWGVIGSILKKLESQYPP